MLNMNKPAQIQAIADQIFPYQVDGDKTSVDRSVFPPGTRYAVYIDGIEKAEGASYPAPPSHPVENIRKLFTERREFNNCIIWRIRPEVNNEGRFYFRCGFTGIRG